MVLSERGASRLLRPSWSGGIGRLHDPMTVRRPRVGHVAHIDIRCPVAAPRHAASLGVDRGDPEILSRAGKIDLSLADEALDGCAAGGGRDSDGRAAAGSEGETGEGDSSTVMSHEETS